MLLLLRITVVFSLLGVDIHLNVIHAKNALVETWLSTRRILSAQ